MFIVVFIASDVKYTKMFFSLDVVSLVWIFTFYSNPAQHKFFEHEIVAFALKIIRFGSIRISKMIMCLQSLNSTTGAFIMQVVGCE